MRTCSLISALALVFVLGCCGKKSTAAPEPGGTRTEAPQHNAPDQDRIDSLKQEKMKGKP
jgi:hypothetical protein